MRTVQLSEESAATLHADGRLTITSKCGGVALGRTEAKNLKKAINKPTGGKA